MSTHSLNTWDLAVNDFFDYAIESSTNAEYAESSFRGSHRDRARPSATKQDSDESVLSHSSTINSVSSGDIPSPTMLSPEMDKANCLGGQIQLIWSPEAHDFVPAQPAFSEQHHEKSCSRCCSNETEARRCRLDRRREQNRESQRKFRARKEAKIREAAGQVATLEAYVEFLEKHNSNLEEVNGQLQQRIAHLSTARPTCHIHAHNPQDSKDPAEGSSIWTSNTQPNTGPTSTQGPMSPQSPDMHLSLFDHELLPPYHMSMGQ